MGGVAAPRWPASRRVTKGRIMDAHRPAIPKNTQAMWKSIIDNRIVID
jgi:hypothetical protein